MSSSSSSTRRSSAARKREPLSPLNKLVGDQGSTSAAPGASASNSPKAKSSKAAKVTKRTARAVRRKGSPYLDVPVSNKSPNLKAELLRASKDVIQQPLKSTPNNQGIKSSPKRRTKRKSSPSSVNVTPEKAKNSISKKHMVPVDAKRSRDSPSSIIQNMLRESFETKVKGILPTIWQSPKAATQGVPEQSGSLALTKDSIIDTSVSETLPSVDRSNERAEDRLITDSRTSTPTQSPKKHSLPLDNLDKSNDHVNNVSLSLNQQESVQADHKDSPLLPENKEFVVHSFQPLPQIKLTSNHENLARSPSPNAVKKTVGFSDDIEHFSSPPPSSPLKLIGPLKSILKAKEFDADDQGTFDDFNSKSFWVSGAIVQLPAGSNDNVHFINRAVNDLSDPNFSSKFEAYTSLNSIVKLNPGRDSIAWFSPKCNDLLNFIQRDITEGVDYGNPFFSRTIIQALKLVSFFFSQESLNTLLPATASRGFILRCCKLIQSTEISKGMASMLLQLLRDQRLPRNIVTPKTGEFILQAILNMRTFSSISLTIERINTLKDYIKNNFTMAQKNAKVWLGFLFINITDTTSVASSRIVAAAAQLLSEVCAKFIDNKAFKFALFALIHQPLSLALSEVSSQSQSQVDSDSLSKDIRLLDYVCEKLEIMLSTDNAAVVMDIWFHLTLLLSRDGKDEGLENWDGINIWVNLFKQCFSLPSVDSKVCAIRAWRAVVYSCAQTWNKSMSNSNAQKKFSLVILPFIFSSVQVSAAPIIYAFHSLFLTTLYAFHNPASLNFKDNHHLMDEVWVYLIEPVFIKLFSHKSEPLSGELIGAKLFNNLLASNASVRKVDLIKCLQSDSMTFQEINPLPARWVYQHPKVAQEFLQSAFAIQGLPVMKKLEFFTNYLNCLKMTISREMKQTGKISIEVTNRLPSLVQSLFQNISISNSPEFITGLLIRLNDAAGIGSLIDDSKDSRNSCHTIISKIISSNDYSPKKLVELCKFISNTLGSRLQLPFYQDLLEFQNNVLHSFVIQKINDRNFSKTTSREYIYLGEIFKAFHPGDIEDYVIVSLMGHILNPIAEKHPVKAIESLKIDSWNIQLFSCAILQVMDSKSKSSISRSPQTQSILKFLISNRLLSGDPVDSLRFLELLCLPNRRLDILKFAQAITKGLNFIYKNYEDKRQQTEKLSLRILGLYSDDKFGLESFKGLLLIAEQHNKAVVKENPGVFTSSLPAEIVVEDSSASSMDTLVIPSSTQSSSAAKAANSSMELLMENDDSENQLLSSSSEDEIDESKINEGKKLQILGTAAEDFHEAANVSLDTGSDFKNDAKDVDSALMRSEEIVSSIPSPSRQMADTQVIVEETEPDHLQSSNVILENENELPAQNIEAGGEVGEEIGEAEKIHHESVDNDDKLEEASKKRSRKEKCEPISTPKKQKVDEQSPKFNEMKTNVDTPSPRINEENGKEGADMTDVVAEMSSISSLSDLDDSFDSSDLEREFSHEISATITEEAASGASMDVVETSIVEEELSSGMVIIDRTNQLKQKKDEERLEQNAEDEEVVKSISDGVGEGGIGNEALMGVMVNAAKEIDVKALNKNEKEQLENELLRFIMRLRSLD